MPAESDLADRFYYLERLRLVDGEPVFFEKLIIPSRHLPDFPEQVLENRSWFDLLRTKYELIVQGGEQKLLATAATHELAHRLNVSPRQPGPAARQTGGYQPQRLQLLFLAVRPHGPFSVAWPVLGNC